MNEQNINQAEGSTAPQPAAFQGLLANAIHHRRELMQRLTTIMGHTQHPDFQNYDVLQLSERLRRFEEGFKTLESANAMAKDSAHDPAERERLSNEFYEFEERYLDALVNFKRRMQEIAPQPPAVAQEQADVAAAAAPGEREWQVKLQFQPNITPSWGKFDGNILNWRDFKNRFELATNHIPADFISYKLSLLRDSMTGSAADTMRGWNLTAESYEQAWEALTTKYEKRYPLASAFLTKFHALPKLERRPRAEDLSKMVNVTNELLRQIHDLKYGTVDWDLLIVQSLHARLDTDTAGKWESERKGDDEPTIVQITTFLENQAALITNKGLAHPTANFSVTTDRPRRTTSGRQPDPYRFDDDQTFPCAACGRYGHKPDSCESFGLLVYYDDRAEVAKAKKMCINCLKYGHYKHQCFDTKRCPLPECADDNLHNSLLCPKRGPRRPGVAQALAIRNDTPPPPSDQDLRHRLAGGRGRGSLNKRPSSSNS